MIDCNGTTEVYSPRYSYWLTSITYVVVREDREGDTIVTDWDLGARQADIG